MLSLRINVLLLFIVISCSAQKPVHQLHMADGKLLVFLDSAAAGRTLVVDRTDRYFERVTAAEMSIQMKQPLRAGQDRQSLLPAYLEYLKKDVEDFTPAESAFTAEVMREVFKATRELSDDIFPDTLLMIKTKGTHYGPSVYYTRENCIVIPADVLEARQREAFTSTMFHELFHVYSRLNPDKQRQLYRLIGFEPIGYDNLRLPPALAERVLFNPDGVDFGQKISLRLPDGSQVDAIPVIYANHPGFKKETPEFFGYLQFNLFQITPDEKGGWRVITRDDGFSSTLDINKLPDFFRQIRDNTGYIIHPDEVLADNFSFLLRGKTNPKVTERFSPEGKELLKMVEAVLREK
jgi:hypothetical protein